MGVRGRKTSARLAVRQAWFDEFVGADGLCNGRSGDRTSSRVKTRYHRPGSNRRK